MDICNNTVKSIEFEKIYSIFFESGHYNDTFKLIGN